MRQWIIAAAGVIVAAGFAAAHAEQSATAVAAAAGGKADIKQFMKDTHKGNDAMIKRATAGKASADEVRLLLEGYRAMAAATPPQGELDSWKTKTAALVAAAEKLAKSDAAGAPALKRAANCKACHEIHKPK